MSLFEALVKDRAKKEKKPMPKFSNGFGEKAHRIEREGDVSRLKKLLKKENRIQLQNPIPEVLPLFHSYNRGMIRQARAIQRILDPSIDILEKTGKRDYL
jgi:hypothetical protein